MPPGGNPISISPIDINEIGTRNTLNIITPNIREITNSSDTNRGFIDTNKHSAPSYLAQDLNIAPNTLVNLSYTNQDFIDKKTRNVFFVDNTNKTGGNLSLRNVEIDLKNGNGATVFYVNKNEVNIGSGSINMIWDDRTDKYRSGSSDIAINATSKVNNAADINITNVYNATAITLRGNQSFAEFNQPINKLTPVPDSNKVVLFMVQKVMVKQMIQQQSKKQLMMHRTGGETVIIPSGTYLIDGTTTQPTQGKWGGNIFGLMKKKDIQIIQVQTESIIL